VVAVVLNAKIKTLRALSLSLMTALMICIIPVCHAIRISVMLMARYLERALHVIIQQISVHKKHYVE
jgi:hypothetical protein